VIDIIVNTDGAIVLAHDEKTLAGRRLELDVSRSTGRTRLNATKEGQSEVSRELAILRDDLLVVLLRVSEDHNMKALAVRMSGWSIAETSSLILRITD